MFTTVPNLIAPAANEAKKAVEKVGRAGQQQTQADEPAVPGQCCRRQDRDQQDPGAREKVGQPP
jgi:hypothetical protein